MIGLRARYSLAQFLSLQEVEFAIVLLTKHEVRISVEGGDLLRTLTNSIRSQPEEVVLSILDEIIRTGGDLRSRVNPKYRYDERMADLKRCLQLDGHIVSKEGLIPIDPSIDDAPPMDDDLVQALKLSGLPLAEEIIRKINSSAESFRAAVPNYNACLNDIRVALESLAAAIAQLRTTPDSPSYDPTKWGSILGFLRLRGLITQEEERGLAGVYGFISPGSHRPLGLSEDQMARLGRSLALGMCWFLVKINAAEES